MAQILCNKCRLSFRANNFAKHDRVCDGPKKVKIPKRIWVDYNPMIGYKDGTIVHSRKGKTKEACEAVARQAETLKSRIKSGEVARPAITEEGRSRLSAAAKRNKLGGYRPHPNRGVRYKGIWLDSKWELQVAESLDENQIRWVRPKVGFVWTDEGRKYYPDFFLPDFDLYLDPKHPYLQVRDWTKIQEAQKRNNIRVLMLNEDQLTWKIIAELM